jgi:hypothetical protein
MDDPVVRCARTTTTSTHSESAPVGGVARPSVPPSYCVDRQIDAADHGAPPRIIYGSPCCVWARRALVCVRGGNGKWRVESARAVVVREAKVSKPLQVME